MVAPNYSKNSEPLSSLHSLATATLAAAKLILDFRSRRTGHKIWHEELEPRLRPSLRQLLVDKRTAENARNETSNDLDSAQRGRFRVGTIEGRRPLPAAQKRHDRAEARRFQANDALKDAAYPMARAENLLIARRLQELGRDFLALRTDYVSAFERHEKALARLDRASAQIGEWSGTSFCDVLAQITGDLVKLLDHQVHPPAHFMDSVILADRLKTLDHDVWKKLDIAVRKEAAAVEAEPQALAAVSAVEERTRAASVGTDPWPPPELASVLWSELSEMEREQMLVFVKAGRDVVLEVSVIAQRARGLDEPNRHDYETAKALDEKGLTEKVGKTGRRLVAVPKGTPLS